MQIARLKSVINTKAYTNDGASCRILTGKMDVSIDSSCNGLLQCTWAALHWKRFYSPDAGKKVLRAAAM
jgi:hypothetical protein